MTSAQFKRWLEGRGCTFEPGRGGHLTAEIVEQVDSVIGLQLERRFVDLRGRVVAQVEHIHRQFSAGYDERPLALHPAPVIRRLAAHGGERTLLVLVDAFVTDGIEDAHDGALAIDGMWHKDRRALQVVERFDEIGLAVAGLSVDQHGFPGTDGGPHLRKHLLGNHHSAQRFRQGVLSQPPLCRPLAEHLLAVLGEGHRGGPGILGGLEHLPRQHAARFRQPHYSAYASHTERALDLDVVLQLQRLDQVFNHAEPETDRCGQVLSVKIAAIIEDLQD